jgi:hypothetical protein
MSAFPAPREVSNHGHWSITERSQLKMNPADRELTKKLRSSISSDKSLSTDAHNIKIISQENGTVTLRPCSLRRRKGGDRMQDHLHRGSRQRDEFVRSCASKVLSGYKYDKQDISTFQRKRFFEESKTRRGESNQ